MGREPVERLVAEARPSSRSAPSPAGRRPGSPPTSGLKYDSGTGIIRATLTSPSTSGGRRSRAVAQRADSVEPSGTQSRQQREHAERRQELPDAIVPRRVRQRPQDHKERPVTERPADRTARPAAIERPAQAGHGASSRNPTGVTRTVQTSVLYQGSDSSGVW